MDVDNNKVVNAKVEMTYMVDGELKKERSNTPILLQESKKLLSVRIIDENYFDIDFDFENAVLNEPRVIYVKRKVPKSIEGEEYKHLAIFSDTEEFSESAVFDNEIHYKGLSGLFKPASPTNLVVSERLKGKDLKYTKQV